MKPLKNLTLEDLVACPVWRHFDSDGVESVESAPGVAELHDEGGAFIVLTQFSLHDGSGALGFSSPSDPSGLDYIQPTIVSTGGHTPLWYDHDPGPQAITDSLQRLCKSIAEVFPLRFEAQIPTDGRRVTGKMVKFEFGIKATTRR